MSNITLALEITALGMGLVFAAILLLWGMMSLLTAVTAEKGTASRAPIADSVVEDESMAHAAAVAVALALSEQQIPTAPLLAEPPTAIVSAWQLGMRTRQMYQKGAR